MNKITIPLICFSVFLLCCKKEEVKPATNTTTTNTAQPELDTVIVGQFNGNFDGADIGFVYYALPVRSTTSVGVTSNHYKTTYSVNPDSTIEEFSSTLYFQDFDETLDITSLSLYAGTQMDTIQFLSSFPDGNYPYSSTEYNSIEISYYDPNREQWSTALGSADQSLSSFNRKIIRIEDSNQVVFFSASFNCTLYNISGQSKTIKNGYYIGYYTID